MLVKSLLFYKICKGLKSLKWDRVVTKCKQTSQKEQRRCDRVVDFIIPLFLNCSTCFRRHTAHHQELKNCNCRFWFYIRFWLPAAITVFELLMMGGVSPETCWEIKKQWNNKFYYTVASCWLFLWDLYYNARIHEHKKCKQSGVFVISHSEHMRNNFLFQCRFLVSIKFSFRIGFSS
jgi:hypothetical protein